MTDKDFEKQKNRIRKYTNKWRSLLGLWIWTGNIGFSEDRKKGEAEGTEALADVYADWKYLDYDITFYLPCFVKKTEKDVERVVIHEMCHILVNEMREEGLKHEERVVSGLTNVLEWVWQDGQKHAPKKVKIKKIKKK